MERTVSISKECFTYNLVEIAGIKGWELHANFECKTFRNPLIKDDLPVISFRQAFSGYPYTDIDIGGLKTDYAMNLDRMFMNSHIQKLNCSSIKFENTLSASQIFSGCSDVLRLTNLSIDLSNYQSKTINDWLDGCRPKDIEFVSLSNPYNIDISGIISNYKELNTIRLFSIDTEDIVGSNGVLHKLLKGQDIPKIIASDNEEVSGFEQIANRYMLLQLSSENGLNELIRKIQLSKSNKKAFILINTR